MVKTILLRKTRQPVRVEWAVMLVVVLLPLVSAAVWMWWNGGTPTTTDVSASDMRGVSPGYWLMRLGGILPSVIMMLYIFRLRKTPVAHFGLSFDRFLSTVLEGLLLFAVAVGLLYAMGLYTTIHKKIATGGDWCSFPGDPSFLLLFGSLLAMTTFAFVNGFFEELLRGYIIRRTADAWGSVVLGAVVSVIAFYAYHCYYQGWHLVWILTIAVMWAIYYLLRRNILAMTISHIMLDLLTFMLNDFVL